MAKRKDKTKIIAQMRLGASRKPYYFQVFLWDDIKSLRAYFHDPADPEATADTLAMTSFEAWYVDPDNGSIYINPKLGEIHFARDHWNVNIIAHEVQHAIMHRMRLIWPPAHLLMLDEYADAEEEIAYETGHWVAQIHKFCQAHNPVTVEFDIPRYTSTVRYPKSGLRLAKPKKEAK